MSEFEKLYGDVLITPEDNSIINHDAVMAALTEVALEVKDGEEVILVDTSNNIFRKQSDGSFHLNPKRDYVIMRRTCFPTLSGPTWVDFFQKFVASSSFAYLWIEPPFVWIA